VNFSAKEKGCCGVLSFAKKKPIRIASRDIHIQQTIVTPLGGGDNRARISTDNRAPGSGIFPPILPGGKRIEAFPCDPISVTKYNGGGEFGNNAVKETEKNYFGTNYLSKI